LDVSIEQVKALREKTGAGIMDCQKALTESKGDFEKAIEYLRKKGAAASQRRMERIAKEGLIIAKSSSDRAEAAIVEVNSETDFVSRSAEFQQFTNSVVDAVFKAKSETLADVLKQTINGLTVEQAFDELLEKVGEKCEIRRIAYFTSQDGFFCEYNHVGNKIASIIELQGEITDEGKALGNELAMQVVAMKPIAIDRTGISAETIEKEKEIYTTQAKNEKKPEKIIEKIVMNKVEKYYQENTLVDQEFIKEAGRAVSDIINAVNKQTGVEYKVKRMVRYQLGETL
jgi:elongation factor Ts